MTFNETLIETSNAYLNACLNERPHEEGYQILTFAFFKHLQIAVLQSFYSTDHDINEQLYPWPQWKMETNFLPLMANQKSKKKLLP